MSGVNQTVMGALPTATADAAEAYLVEYAIDPTQEIKVWSFLYNPQSLRFSGEANYNPSGVFAAPVQDLTFANTGNTRLDISNIILFSYQEGRSVLPLLTAIDQLRKADIANSRFAPKVLSFVFGKRRFSPCVLVKADWDESAWLGGDPARVVMNLSFLESVPPGKLGIQNIAPDLIQTNLTERQLADSAEATKTLLMDTINTLPPDIANAVRSSQYNITTNPETGVITITDSAGKTIGIVGTYKDNAIDTSNQTLTRGTK